MKHFLQNSTIVATLLFFSFNAHAQWYSYDKAEKTEKDPDGINKLIHAIAPPLVPGFIGLPAVPPLLPGNLSQKKKALEVFLNINRARINTLIAALKVLPVLNDDQKTLLYYLEKKKSDKRWIFPVRTVEESEAFYENSDSLVLSDKDGLFNLEHAYLNYLSQSKKLAAYSEVANDFIGPVRISLGLLALAPSTKDSAVTTKKSDSIYDKKLFQERFKSGGGMAQLNVSFPLLHIHDSKYIDIKAYASPRFCIDVPKEDTNVQRFAHHTQLGGEVQVKLNTVGKTFTFLFCWRGFQAWGNSTFYDNMGFADKERKSFNFNTWTAGLIVKSKMQFYYTWYTGDTRAINQMPKQNTQSLTANYQF